MRALFRRIAGFFLMLRHQVLGRRHGRLVLERADGVPFRDLTALPFVEYLTRDRLARVSEMPRLAWPRLRVRYPLWYELRPLVAFLRRRRPPSRFDVWVAEVL